MNASPDPRLDELFVRYWDNVLTQAEATELDMLLANDSAAREWFQILVAQAVMVAELPVGPLPAPATEPANNPNPLRRPHWSRRKALAFFGGTIAASIGAGLVGHAWWQSSCEATQSRMQVRIRDSKGAAMIRTADGQTLLAEAEEIVPPGATVATQGFGSSATLAFEDGSTVLLHSDSAISVREKGQLQLHKGTASAELLPRENAERITLATTLLTLAHVHDTSITLGTGTKSAEVAVYQGEVSVSAPTGEPMTVVREGEMLTVGENGVRSQQPAPTTPDHFAWDLTTPLPTGWHIGRREILPDRIPVVLCEAYPDPYYNGVVMRQIRSDNKWSRGLFSLVPGSTIHVRYRTKTDSPRGQVCICVRTAQPRCSDAGVLEYNRGFKASSDGQWRELSFTAESMKLPPNVHVPKFSSPWVGFLVIFNTFEPDVGLEIAEFRVDPPK